MLDTGNLPNICNFDGKSLIYTNPLAQLHFDYSRGLQQYQNWGLKNTKLSIRRYTNVVADKNSPYDPYLGN